MTLKTKAMTSWFFVLGIGALIWGFIAASATVLLIIALIGMTTLYFLQRRKTNHTRR